MKNAIQDGKTIAFAPTAAVASGGVVLIVAMLAVAVKAVEANAEGDFLTEGVFELPKAAADDISIGAQLYWDDSAKNITTVVGTNKPAGKAWADAGNGDTTVAVKINA